MAQPVRKTPAPWLVDLEPSEGEQDPFVFGWRVESVHLPGGGIAQREVPLTAAALLDPQDGDHLVQGLYHFKFSQMLYDLFDRRYQAEKDVLVTSDFKLCWGIPGLKEPAPDVAVIRGVRDKEANRESFDVVQEGVVPSLVVEVVSSKTAAHRRADYEDKVEIYEQAGVPEYVLVDPQFHLKAPRLRITGHRLDASGRSQAIEPDRRGRLLSETTGVWFTASPDGQRLWLVDVETGERLLTALEVENRAERETAARRRAEDLAERQAAELARLREEIARLKGSHS